MKKEEKILIFDFGLGDIRSLLADKKNNSFQALASANEGLIVENNELFIQNSSLACRNIFSKMQGLTLQKPDGIVVGLPSSFVYSIIIRQKFERVDKNSEIDKKELEIFEKELKKSALSELRTEDELSNEEIEFLGISFESFSINGYAVKNILGSKGNEVEILALIYFMSESDKDFINHILIKNFSLPIKKFLYSPLEMARLYKFSNPSSYAIIVYAGYQSSEIFLIDKQSIVAKTELNLGWSKDKNEQKFFLHELELVIQDMNIFGYPPNDLLIFISGESQQEISPLLEESKIKERFNIKLLDSKDLKIKENLYQKVFPTEAELQQNLSLVTLNENLKNYDEI